MFILFNKIYLFFFLIEPIPYISPNQQNNAIERPRPTGNNSDAFIRSASMRSGDHNQITMNTCKRQNSLTYNDLPSIQEMKYKNSIPSTSNKVFLYRKFKIILFYFSSRRG